MKAITKITFLDDNGEKFFGEGPARLLRGVEAHGSLRAAALSMEMAYTKALKLMKNAETALGFPLIARVTGGKSGGGSTLTPAGKEPLVELRVSAKQGKQLFWGRDKAQGVIVTADKLTDLLRKRSGGGLDSSADGRPDDDSPPCIRAVGRNAEDGGVVGKIGAVPYLYPIAS